MSSRIKSQAKKACLADSGVVIPVFEVSAGSSGMAFIAASSFQDWDYLRALATTIDMAGFPSRKNGQLKYCASNQVGDAALLYASVLGPLWKRDLQTMNAIFGLLRRLWNADPFSPKAFVVRAAILSVLYPASRLLALQEYTAFLSGTSASGNLSWQTASTLGLIHLLLHVSFILLVPISVITAGLLAAWNRWKPGREVPTESLPQRKLGQLG